MGRSEAPCTLGAGAGTALALRGPGVDGGREGAVDSPCAGWGRTQPPCSLTAGRGWAAAAPGADEAGAACAARAGSVFFVGGRGWAAAFAALALFFRATSSSVVDIKCLRPLTSSSVTAAPVLAGIANSMRFTRAPAAFAGLTCRSAADPATRRDAPSPAGGAGSAPLGRGVGRTEGVCGSGGTAGVLRGISCGASSRTGSSSLRWSAWGCGLCAVESTAGSADGIASSWLATESTAWRSVGAREPDRVGVAA